MKRRPVEGGMARPPVPARVLGSGGRGVLFAHIHFGQKDVNGGVSAFLCGGGDKPPCPMSGTVRGAIDPADIIGPSGQGIAPGEFDEVVAAMEAAVTYANVHTQMFPGGEIRGQIQAD
jgi:CHRD domain